ncbi:HAMP domain-containing sensor histidine kinase [Marinobacter sp. 2_MG-2023]|uniref:sensor histidine kinase n=1 Tax=Marinobacter sp. 2_MG-2023 TaxID=3062679 RepID=UPI0026E1D9EF|nr:HAMP domain-containing sensor histidine kinase [Marinobacter sp. 2_MG-2023]MDO6442671.1 HAMP domain-containing sensor histidine kinase [Marinobacter sp. 2_MG-2023]
MNRRVMFPLFWRIFLLIWLAMAVTVVVSNLASQVLLDRERAAIERQLELRDLGFDVAAIRERQGRREAHRFLSSQGDELGLHLMMISADSDERLPPAIRSRIESGWYRQKPAIVDLGDGYRLIAWPKMHGEGWLEPRVFRFMEMGLAFVLITLACWLIARFVSRPMRHMERTARAIAGGNTELRVDERIANRRDEVGQLATAFNGMTDQLCKLLDRQKHLLRDISHDLRTPLARQRIAIELASEGGVEDDLMASILRQNERLDSMTGQILTLYRVTEQGGDIAREPERPVDLVNQVLRDAADYAEHQRVDCKLDSMPESTGVSVLGDAGLLQRAFDNILQNALDHTPPGKVVHIALKVSSGWISLAIEDEGPGVPGEILDHLFEPFFRGDKSRGGEGWGLGLAIAKDIILAHDGEITANNSQRGGLQILVRLPVFAVD